MKAIHLAIALVVLAGISTGILLKFKTYDSAVPLAVIILFGIYALNYLILRVMGMQEEKGESQTIRLHEIWQMANDELSRMYGGVVIDWNRGLDRTVERRSFLNHAGESVPFVAIRAHTENSQMAKIIVNLKEKHIECYKTNIGSAEFANPWTGFEPFQKKQMMSYPYGYGRKRSRMPSRLTLNFGDESPAQPEEDTLRTIAEKVGGVSNGEQRG